MTAAALAAKIEKDTPPPSYKDFDLLNSPEFDELAEEQRRVAQMSREVECFKGKGKVEGYAYPGGQKDIEAMLLGSGVERVLWKDGYIVKTTSGKSADTISATRLLELGVSMDTIAAATVEGTVWTSVQMVAPRAGK